MIERPSLSDAATFLLANGRRLERALYARLFESGPGDAVRAAVAAYRNPDGGFGHALEPDIRAPDSMPLHGEIALRALVDASVRDSELVSGLCDYLASVAEPDGRLPIVTPAVTEHPHAPHWAYPSPPDSPNPTAGIVGLLHAQGAVHPWLEQATGWCWRRLDEPIGEAHMLVSCLLFLEHAADRERALELAPKIVAQAEGAMMFVADPASEAYGVTPLQLCPRPSLIGADTFAPGILDAHLDALAARQQDDGGWPIAFEPASEMGALEWRARFTFEAIATLRAYGRI